MGNFTILKKLLFIIVLLSLTGNLKSQLKGSFNDTLQIVTGQRTISFYVPTDYDSTKKYSLMVCLHGAGQPAASYRDNLAVPLASFIKNTIFACPEGGGASGDFYNAAGDQTIIDSAISYSESHYSIDKKQIILQGFSLGGRSALKYGLEHTDIFKGLLLNTPAIQSNSDANNRLNLSLIYNYQNASKIPIAMTHGATDLGYYHIVDTVYKRLTDANGMVIFTRVAGLGHNIPSQAIIQKCIDFINQPLKNINDADITNVMPPERIYQKAIQPLFRFRNRGSAALNSAVITYTINGTPSTYSWSGDLTSFQVMDLPLPQIISQENVNTLVVKIDSINGVAADPTMSTKVDSSQFQCLTQSIKMPFEYGFEMTEASDPFWGLHFSGGMTTWGVYTDAKTEGNNAALMYNTPFFNIDQGLSENLLSPMVDLTSVNNPCLTFDEGFNYIYLTPPAYSNYFTFTDTLQVLMSTDGGKTYKTLYSKSGKDLATASSPITNPPTLNDCIFIPTSSQWRKEVIRLDDYKADTSAVFIFKYISGLGGSIWLDNINFMSYDDLDVATDNKNNGLLISPNPAVDNFNIKLPDDSRSLNIYDLNGKLVYNRILIGEGSQMFSAGNFDNGVYIVEVLTTNKSIRQKLIISK